MGLPRSTYYDAPAVEADDGEIVAANRAAAQDATRRAPVDELQARSPSSFCADGISETDNNDGHLRGCADAEAGHRQGNGLDGSPGLA